MRHRYSRLLLAASVALLPVLATSASAADTTLGATFVPSLPCNTGYTVIQTASPGGAYTVPAAGVITSWSFAVGATAPTNVGLKVGRAAAGTYDIVGSSALTTPTAGETLVTRPARIPVATGDVLGSYVDNNAPCVQSAAATYAYAVAMGNIVSGPINAGSSTSGTAVQVDIAAKIEPDADSDGFGDTTQDLCPTKATTQAECVAPVTSVSAKASKAKKKPNGKYKKAKVTVVFAVSEPSTSTCSIDGAPATPCVSPVVFKAKKGTHNITVVSKDAAGNVGTAATTSVKVKKAKPKK